MRGAHLRCPYHLYQKKNKSVSCFSCLQTYYTRSHGMCQPSRRGRNADKGISDGLECVGGEPRGFHGAVDGTAAE